MNTLRRGRFAPTPSGSLHLGNALTALLAWLQIRQVEGAFIVRMEDVDEARSRVAYAEAALRDLRWIGLDWDEGPDVGGNFGPYVQSERFALYQAALEKLERDGRLYPCYCSRKELQNVPDAPHGVRSEGPTYPGTCKHLTRGQRMERERMKKPSLRFALPEMACEFHDLFQAEQHFLSGFGGDFVIRRSDGVFAYQLAVVVDDALMGVTDVVRGADLIDSTPRQLWLYEALGWTPPQFGHVPLLHGPDGARMSKREHGTHLEDLRERGVRPQRVIGALAYLASLIDKLEELNTNDLLTHLGQAPMNFRGQQHVTLTKEVMDWLKLQ